MANMKHFSDFNGETFALIAMRNMNNADFAVAFPGVKGIRNDSFSKRVGIAELGGPVLPLTRCIEYKAFPSKHECNAKCLNGKCNGKCECHCGGKNHGRGSIAA